MSSPEASSFDREILGLGNTQRPQWIDHDRVATVSFAEQRPFPEDEYARRETQTREAMSAAGIAALLVFRPSSVEYLCGFHTAETVPQPLLLTHSSTSLYVPDLEIGRALASSRTQQLLYYGYAQAHRALELITAHAAEVVGTSERLGIEFEHTSTPPRAIALLNERRVRVTPANHLVERLRLILSPAEVDYVERAAEATRRGVEAGTAAASAPGATDSSIAAAISHALLVNASAPSAWGPVVVNGQRGGIPHSSWKNHPLSGNIIFLEFAGAEHRYHAPVMRTLCRERPSSEERRLIEFSTTVVGTVLENARDGVPCSEVAQRARLALGTLPDDTVFHSVFGYPVGLAHPPHWMDGAPWHITEDNPEPLRSGMVLHIPGSFRSFGSVGVGLSQTFLVEANGARALTHGPAELIEL